MGYTYRDNGVFGEIKDFEPDNDSNTLYIQTGYCNLEQMIEKVKQHFGKDVDLSKLVMTAEHIHTECLGYDRYDAGDYTNYVVITLY